MNAARECIPGSNHSPGRVTSADVSVRRLIQGIGAGFVLALLDRALVRDVQQAHDEEVRATSPRLSRIEGIAFATRCSC